MDLREIAYDAVDRVHLAQKRDRLQALVKTVINIRIQ
jgi:hypothetical protein